MKVDPILLSAVSDLFLNLSAGWFGAALIVPAFSGKPLSFDLLVLTMDIVLGILFLGIAFKLRKLGEGEEV